jgi:predicted nucleotidyltransferase
VPERIPASLMAALADLMKWFDAAGIPAMIIGGVAASILGRARLTRDVDALAMIPEAEWANALSVAANQGIVVRNEATLDFARSSRMLLLRHSASDIDIDVALAGLSFELQALTLGQVHEVGGVALRLPRVEDLLVMKAFAHRPKDMEDIEGLLAVHPGADLVFVRQWLREFSAAVNMPDLLDDFEKAVARRRAPTKV